MDADLLTLKMAVVSGDDSVLDLLHRAAGAATLPIDVATFGLDDMAAAQDVLSCGVDMLFVDGALAPDVQSALVDAARSGGEGSVVVRIGVPDRDTGTSADGVEADAVLETPLDNAKTRAAVDCCARARRPNRVLVVDDSPTVRSIVRKMMRVSRFSLQTEETGEGEVALDLMRSGRFDIVFLDCNMPGLDGAPREALV